MKLDRNTNEAGRGKYALLKLRELASVGSVPGKTFRQPTKIERALNTLDAAGLIEWGAPNTEGEFFVLKLRDAYAEAALTLYANTAMLAGDGEYAREVKALADRAGARSLFCKKPD